MKMEMTNEQTLLQDIKAELESVPSFLYKYCTVEKAAEILETAAFKLSSPQDFNDPFDTHCQIRKPNNKEEWREWVYQHYPPDEWLEIILRAEKRFQLPEEVISLELTENMKLTGVSCFSETRDSILMWGHYAKCHSGICLGFNGIPLREYTLVYWRIKNNSRIPKTDRALRKIDYVNDLPEFRIASPDVKKIEFHRQKASIWEYEKEWRIVAFGCAGQMMEFPREILAQIIFGINAKPETIKRIRSIADKVGYSAKFIQAKKSATKYEIEFPD